MRIYTNIYFFNLPRQSIFIEYILFLDKTSLIEKTQLLYYISINLSVILQFSYMFVSHLPKMTLPTNST